MKKKLLFLTYMLIGIVVGYRIYVYATDDFRLANIDYDPPNTLSWFTPPLSEGCVAGVLRRWLLENLSQKNIQVKETALSPEDLLSADELFLTNSIRPVRWVQQFRDKKYSNEKAKEIFNFFLENL